MNLQDLKKKLQTIKNMGFIKTHRKGDTGIGKTLEDMLGIKENNIPFPDIDGIAELKAYRKDATLDPPYPYTGNTKELHLFLLTKQIIFCTILVVLNIGL